jgi:hypothetical protein
VTFFPMLKHSVQHFPFLPISKNIPVRHSPIILIPETTPSSTCFVFPPSFAATPLAATFPVAETPATFHFPPVAETPITSNLSSVFPMLKHHCSAFFISSHPRHSSHCFHYRNNSVQHLFRRSSLCC